MSATWTGEDVRRWYEGRGLSQQEAARLLGFRTRERLSEVVTGKARVAPHTVRIIDLIEQVEHLRELLSKAAGVIAAVEGVQP